MPAAARGELHRQLDPYRRAHPGVRWTSQDTWHLTLLFLGSVEPRLVPQLELLVDAVAARVAAYEVLVDHGGGRIRGNGGVAWLALSRGASTLIEAAAHTVAAYPPDVTPGRPPKRTPSAHLTVARKADQSAVDALRHHEHGRLGVGWRVDRIRLVRSYLESGGARYETLHEATM